jgi:anti-sigma factor RsiW
MKPCANKRRALALHTAGALAHADRLDIDRHLESCAGCRHHLATLQGIAALLTSHGNQNLELEDSLVLQRDWEPKLKAEASRWRPFLVTYRFPRLRLAWIGLLVFAMAVGWIWFQPRPQPSQHATWVHTPIEGEAQLATSMPGAPARIGSGPLPTWMYFPESTEAAALEALLDQVSLQRSQPAPSWDLEVRQSYDF